MPGSNPPVNAILPNNKKDPEEEEGNKDPNKDKDGNDPNKKSLGDKIDDFKDKTGLKEKEKAFNDAVYKWFSNKREDAEKAGYKGEYTADNIKKNRETKQNERAERKADRQERRTERREAREMKQAERRAEIEQRKADREQHVTRGTISFSSKDKPVYGKDDVDPTKSKTITQLDTKILKDEKEKDVKKDPKDDKEENKDKNKLNGNEIRVGPMKLTLTPEGQIIGRLVGNIDKTSSFKTVFGTMQDKYKDNAQQYKEQAIKDKACNNGVYNGKPVDLTSMKDRLTDDVISKLYAKDTAVRDEILETRAKVEAEKQKQQEENAAKFEGLRQGYVNKYIDEEAKKATWPIKDGNFKITQYPADHTKERLSKEDNKAWDLACKQGTSVYITSDQKITINSIKDKKNEDGTYKDGNYGHSITIYDENNKYIYAHTLPDSQVDKDLKELIQQAEDLGISSFVLPAGTKIAETSDTGAKGQYHLHYEEEDL